ncbi:hypothetical protein DPMN_167576 [Dreissena polymorpha]|uniref:Uncharacterized protein n=1 Tax=Dreissena polymorpha TaxID=45954 RepID=A0A9D4F0J7_DREPO|nr:hypothetical protein DPMN_167576 [Dreissena polymorpha]
MNFVSVSRPAKAGYLLYSDGSRKWKKGPKIAWFESPKTKTPLCNVVLRPPDQYVPNAPSVSLLTIAPSKLLVERK